MCSENLCKIGITFNIASRESQYKTYEPDYNKWSFVIEFDKYITAYNVENMIIPAPKLIWKYDTCLLFNKYQI